MSEVDESLKALDNYISNNYRRLDNRLNEFTRQNGYLADRVRQLESENNSIHTRLKGLEIQFAALKEQYNA